MFEDYAVDLEHVISLESTFALAYDVHPGTKAPFPNDESLPSNIVTVGGEVSKSSINSRHSGEEQSIKELQVIAG